MLGRLRLDSGLLRGRRFPEPPHPFRSDLQRDRDRITHARAFRRLEGKTQVFSAGLSDHFRNRLTHTIEVAQVARTVARHLDLNEDFAEALALAHDLGHPPFAHVGERELDRQMRRHGGTFEHNRHSLRIVDTLEQRYARFDGLNLTFEVREGIIKHSRELVPDGDPELLELMPGQRPPLEAQLLDLADEIAYNTADIDDAFSIGLFSLDDLGRAIPAFAEIREQIETSFPGAPEKVQFWEVQRQVLCILMGGLIEGTVRAAEAARVQSVEDVRGLSHRLAEFTPEAAEINRQMKALLVSHVYSSMPLAEDRRIAVAKMGVLFEFLMQRPENVSSGYRTCLETTPVHRVVCDYIAGMTDGYFQRVYDNLLGSRLAS